MYPETEKWNKIVLEAGTLKMNKWTP